jgi:ribosomal protein L19E
VYKVVLVTQKFHHLLIQILKVPFTKVKVNKKSTWQHMLKAITRQKLQELIKQKMKLEQTKMKRKQQREQKPNEKKN